MLLYICQDAAGTLTSFHALTTQAYDVLCRMECVGSLTLSVMTLVTQRASSELKRVDLHTASSYSLCMKTNVE